MLLYEREGKLVGIFSGNMNDPVDFMIAKKWRQDYSYNWR